MARCLGCSYVIEGLAGGDGDRCPECGRSFDLNNPKTFTRRLPFIWWKFWLPGVVLALAFGVPLFAGFTFISGYGVGSTIALPVALGAIIGYRGRLGWLAVVAVPLFAIPFSLSLVAFGVTGVFCGAVVGMIIFVPLGMGAGAGVILRDGLKDSSFSQKGWLPILFFLLIPTLIVLIERVVEQPVVPTSVQTVAIVDAPPEEVWRRLQFYEAVTGPPPLLLRLGLPRPIRTTGNLTNVGDESTCIYDNGRLVKQVAVIEAPTTLAFVVVEQDIGFDSSVHLTGGSFVLAPADGGRARLTLTTEYDAMLRPRFAWAWAEQLAIRAVHEHVIGGIRRDAEAGLALGRVSVPQQPADAPG